MNSFLMKFVLSAVLLLGWILPQTEGVFPIELARIVFALPSTLNVASSRMAYFVLGIGVKLFALCFYLGLPRIPNRPPIRRSFEDQETPSQSWLISIQEMETFLDKISELDKEMCLQRFICHLESLHEDELSLLQKIMLNVLWMSSSPSWNYSSISSPRRRFIDAAYFARTTKCTQCCKMLYKTCPPETEAMLEFF